MTRLADVRQLVLPPGLLEATAAELREFGARGCEGFLLWVGRVEADRAVVLGQIVPPQRPIRDESGVGYYIDADTLFAVNRVLSEKKLRLLAQVHSHPGRAYHSETDDRYAVMTTEGGFSIVVPDFARGPADVQLWAVYRLSQGVWAELSSDAVAASFEISG